MTLVPRSPEGGRRRAIAAVALAAGRRHARPRRACAEPGRAALLLVRHRARRACRLGRLARRSGARCARCASGRRTDAAAGGTVVVLDPEDFTREARALRRFAESGGRVVAGGRDPGAWIEALAPGLEWERGGEEAARVLAATPETDDASELRTAAEGHWKAAAALPVAASADGPIVVVRGAGSRSSPTRRRSRTGCSTRPTTPRSRSRSPARAGHVRRERPRLRRRRPGSPRCRTASSGR